MDISFLPKSPGVYLMKDSSEKIIYIGKAKNLFNRVSQYFRNTQTSWKIPNLVALIRKIDYIPCSSERESLLLERQLIQKYQPFFNVLWKDSKTYPYIKITGHEDFPRLLYTRKKIKDGSIYFGPYPEIASIKKLMNYLWKIKFLNIRRCSWELSSAKKINKTKIASCIYYHTEQCPMPCLDKISKFQYRKSVQRILLFLRGNYKKLLKEFYMQMQKHSLKLEYEKASMYRNFIKTIKHLSEKVTISKFNDITDKLNRNHAISHLQNILKLTRPPIHIEAFDVSSMFAKFAVGSSVCFVQSKKWTKHYRRYKIQFKNSQSGSNDFAMIHEIVARRIKQIKEDNEDPPDLFLIDGGKGHLLYAARAVKSSGLEIPVVSLAKKRHEIFIPGKNKPLILERNNPALLLLQSIQDEAHKFSIKYHRMLRNKSLFK